MRIVAWNIRAGGGRRVAAIARQLQQWQPDVVALSEFRGTPPSQTLAALLATSGLTHQLATSSTERRAANALLLAARYPLHPLPVLRLDPPSPLRWLPARLAAPQPLTLAALHVPTHASKQKQSYFTSLLALLRRWPPGPGLIIGDTNSGLPDIDEENPAFSAIESEWFAALAELGWHDLFRRLHGDTRAYTWYSPNAGNGFRLDQAFGNPELLPSVQTMRYVWGVNAVEPSRRDALSDHAAILLDLATGAASD